MKYRVETRGYRRRFERPLATANGPWRVREGLLVRLEDEDGRVGFGEVAPLRRAGCETLPTARRFFEELPPRLDDEGFRSIPRDLPCCRVALESARALINEPETPFSFANTALLPGSELAILALERALSEGYKTFKIKIGVRDREDEQNVVAALLEGLPEDAELRLDANGSLGPRSLRSWLEFLRGRAGVDFIEQPMAVGEEEEAAEIGLGFQTELALDESVSAQGQLVNVASGRLWSGPLVIKPLLFGDLEELVRMAAPLNNRLIVSSVFETGVGLLTALRTAAALGVEDAVGFGTLACLNDELRGPQPAPILTSEALSLSTLADIWERLGQR
jgi:O-succinylbenzoate synthase